MMLGRRGPQERNNVNAHWSNVRKVFFLNVVIMRRCTNVVIFANQLPRKVKKCKKWSRNVLMEWSDLRLCWNVMLAASDSPPGWNYFSPTASSVYHMSLYTIWLTFLQCVLYAPMSYMSLYRTLFDACSVIFTISPQVIFFIASCVYHAIKWIFLIRPAEESSGVQERRSEPSKSLVSKSGVRKRARESQTE